MNPTPGLPPEFLHRNLEEIARKDHGDEGGGKQNSRPAVLPVTILDALPSVPLPNHPGSEDEDGSGENVEVLEVVLEGMDSRPEFIRRNLGKPKGPEISQARGSHQAVRVAPVMAWIPFFRCNWSSSRRPGNWAYQRGRGR